MAVLPLTYGVCATTIQYLVRFHGTFLRSLPDAPPTTTTDVGRYGADKRSKTGPWLPIPRIFWDHHLPPRTMDDNTIPTPPQFGLTGHSRHGITTHTALPFYIFLCRPSNVAHPAVLFYWPLRWRTQQHTPTLPRLRTPHAALRFNVLPHTTAALPTLGIVLPFDSCACRRYGVTALARLTPWRPVARQRHHYTPLLWLTPHLTHGTTTYPTFKHSYGHYNTS